MTPTTPNTLTKGDTVTVVAPHCYRKRGVFLGWSPMMPFVARVLVGGVEVTADKSQIEKVH